MKVPSCQGKTTKEKEMGKILIVLLTFIYTGVVVAETTYFEKLQAHTPSSALKNHPAGYAYAMCELT